MTIARVLCRIVLAFRRLVGLGSNAVVKRAGINWCLDLNEGIDLVIYLSGCFEKNTLRAYSCLLKQGDVVLDVGGNIGAHTLHFAKLVGENGHVYVFEPTVYAYNKLVENISLNPELSTRITPVQAMLSDGVNRKLESEIYSSWPLKKNDDIHPLHAGRLESTAGAKVFSVDEFISSSGMEKVDFVKLDVDGKEVSILKGAMNTLVKNRCPILIELSFYTLHEADTSVDELLEILNNYGYQITDEVTGEQLPMDTDKLRLMVPVEGSRNVLAQVFPETASASV